MSFVDLQIPKYENIRRQIRERILGGALSVGDQLPPQNSLAKEFDSSLLTVRQALGMLEKEGLISRIHGRGTFVCPSQSESGNGNSARNVVVYAKVADGREPNPLYHEVEIQSLDDILSRQGRHLSIAVLSASDIAQGILHPALAGDGVRGVLLEHSVTDVHVEFLRHKGFPLVVIGDYPISVPVANVAFDQEQAMYQVAQALMRNFTSMPVYFLTEPFRLHYSQMLDAGYRRACEEAGRRPNTRFVWDQVGRPGLEVQRIVDENPGPFGLIVHANIAHELVKIFDKHQLKLSDHPVVILGAADYVSPPVQKQLNRCRVDIPLASSVALDLLDEVIQHDSTRKIYIQPELETSVVDNCFRVNLSWRL